MHPVWRALMATAPDGIVLPRVREVGKVTRWRQIVPLILGMLVSACAAFDVHDFDLAIELVTQEMRRHMDEKGLDFSGMVLRRKARNLG